MDEFASRLLYCLDASESVEKIVCWAVLPNHYHVLAEVNDIRACKLEVGKLHGSTSRKWNLEDDSTGRRVWFRAAETYIKSEAHYWSTVNYVHQNPVKHACTSKQQDWPWSSIHEWLAEDGRDSLVDLWKKYPVDGYGSGWDDQNLSASSAKLLE